MNIGIKWSQWLSDAEGDDLKAMAETINEQNNAAHEARDCAFRTMNIWADRHVQDAIKDGRITRNQAIHLYDRLTTKIIDACMDVIPAPEERPMADKIYTTKFYWDCECPTNYIIPRWITQCQICGAERDSQPDSRLSELGVDQLATINRIAEKYLEEHPDV